MTWADQVSTPVVGVDMESTMAQAMTVRRKTPRKMDADASKKALVEFNESRAERALGEFKVSARSLAEYEANRSNEYRSFARAARDFIVTLFSESDLAAMKSKAGSSHVKVTLNENVAAFLAKHNLPEPYWTSSNPFLGVFQRVFAQSIVDGGHRDGIAEIEDLGDLEPENVIRLTSIHTPLKQQQLTDRNRAIGAVPIKNNSWYLRISKYSMLALASIDLPVTEGGGPSLIDEPINAALERYRKWRKKNPALAIIGPSAKKAKTTKQVKLKPYLTLPTGEHVQLANEAEGTLLRVTKAGGCEVIKPSEVVRPKAVTPKVDRSNITDAEYTEVPNMEALDAALEKKFKSVTKVTTTGFSQDEDTVVLYVVRKTPGLPTQIWSTGDAPAIAWAITQVANKD